ncbi:sensor histidine kinase [Novosphingobium pokkalii]|uniref:sensor histidine kinase n=1 Tax=Novosphingobium pokkalii TaxID=1770194 RepID=UPI00362CD3E0
MTLMPRPRLWSIRGLQSCSPAVRHGVAVALFCAAFGIRWTADALFPPGFPFLTFFPAVIVATFVAGRGPGIVCAVLSGLAAWYFFVPPVFSFVVTPQVATAMLFYSGVVAVDIFLIDGLTRRQRQLEENEARLAEMAAHQALLFKELQHRVANNLASVASMLRLQRRQIERDPALALPLIDRADQRIEMMGRVHRQLYDPAAQSRPIREILSHAVDLAREMADADAVDVRVIADDVRLDVGRLLPLVLLLTELLANSFKHAFAPGERGRIDVRLEQAENDMLCLTVADNGKGLPASDTQPAIAGLPARGAGWARRSLPGWWRNWAARTACAAVPRTPAARAA